MSDQPVYSAEEQARLDELDKEIQALEFHVEVLKRQKQAIYAAQSPIKQGDQIEWTSGSRVRMGVVRAVNTNWYGFTYHTDVINKDGKLVGFAHVETRNHQPVLMDKPIKLPKETLEALKPKVVAKPKQYPRKK